jgi:hypothetical protein
VFDAGLFFMTMCGILLTHPVYANQERTFPAGNTAYEERARRIARLVSELVGLDETGISRIG